MKVWLLLLGLIPGVAVAATSECPRTNQEQRLIEAITPEDHIWIYEGVELQKFFATLNAIGVLQGTPVDIDKVYVTEYKNLYHIFFLSRHCIVDVRDILKSQLRVNA